MYSPAHYDVKDREVAFDVMRKNSFATLINSVNGELVVSHLPLLLDSEKNVLYGHCARANEHWKVITQSKVTAIFHGPHAYISPAWYTPRAGNVPTWNYVAVHVSGSATLIEGPKEVYEVLQRTTQENEKANGTRWELPDAPNADLAKLMNAIVAFKIDIEKLQAKFKLSQNQPAENRDEVIKQLGLGNEMQREVSALMKKLVT
jgi:transcriptional regulator